MRAAVIGTRWGIVHVAALRAAGVEVTALVDHDGARARAVADDLGVPIAFRRATDLASLDLDLVTVATPAHSHVEVIASLPGDLPVLCEKPAIGLAVGPEVLPRAAPVWVNYAFAFLPTAVRATEALPGLGPVRRAYVRSTYDLGRVPLAGDAMLFELVPHPLSWVVTILGDPRACPAPDSSVVQIQCGDVPVELSCARDSGLDGLRHEVVLQGRTGQLELSGSYREGSTWIFDAPRVRSWDGEVRELGDAQRCAEDPWYRANERAIGSFVEVLRGGTADPRLFDWDTGVRLDLAIRAGLAGRSEGD